jgi:hypothetical protein
MGGGGGYGNRKLAVKPTSVSPVEVARLNLINKTRVFLITAARFYSCGSVKMVYNTSPETITRVAHRGSLIGGTKGLDAQAG